MSFRNNLRDTLDFLDMPQKELAAKTGISLKTIENYVKKESCVPSADKAVRIARALGVTVEYLVTGEESAESHKTNVQIRKKEDIAILAKLDRLNSYNYKVIISIVETLLDIQSGKTKR